jgi:ABC-type Fe3+-hydroxamate transport system substrate-binding protein
MKQVFCWGRYLASLLVLVTLSACGQSNTVADAGPEAVHAAWIAAVRDNGRDGALALLAPMGGNEGVFVDDALGRMQQILHDQSNGVVATGPLHGVDTLPLQDAGQGKIGTSVWRFAKKTWCWETALTPTEAGWKVTSWNQRLQCPAGVQ